MNKLLLNILLPILISVLPQITKELKEALEGFIQAQYIKAKTTESKFDDIALRLLAGLLDTELKD